MCSYRMWAVYHEEDEDDYDAEGTPIYRSDPRPTPPTAADTLTTGAAAPDPVGAKEIADAEL